MSTETYQCPRHGGPWGQDETCPYCTFPGGTPRSPRLPGPLGPGGGPGELIAAALEREVRMYSGGFWSTAPWAGVIREHLLGEARNYRKGWRDPETGRMIDPEHTCSNCDAGWDPVEGPRCWNCGEEVAGG